MQLGLIRKLVFYGIELERNATEATKNMCCAKGEYEVNHSSITRSFKKYFGRIVRTLMIRQDKVDLKL